VIVRDCEDSYNDYETFKTRDRYCSDGKLKDYVTVDYEGYTYKAVVIGNKTWMAENLRYAPHYITQDIFGDDIINPVACNRCWGVNSGGTTNNSGGTLAPEIAKGYCEKYGRYYDWSLAMGFSPEIPYTCAWELGQATSINNTRASCNNNFAPNEGKCTIKKPYHRGICPEGWHIPTNMEVLDLYKTSESGKHLAARGQWGTDDVSSDRFGFSAVPGQQLTGSTNPVTNTSPPSAFASWWTTEEVLAANAFPFRIESNGNLFASVVKINLLTIRCVKD
jgi:uncharacterized protein (TIGR02145 family)